MADERPQDHSFSRRQMLAALAGLGLTPKALQRFLRTGVHRGTATGARYLAVIVLDGFRDDYLSLTAMPNLSALMQSGTQYTRAWVGQVETETPVSHASLGRGVVPRHHGVVGFEWRNPDTDTEVFDGWDANGLTVLQDLEAGHTPSIAYAVKAANRSSTVVAISSEKPYAADAIGGPAADYILHHHLTPDGKQLLPTAAPGHVPPAALLAGTDLIAPYPLQQFTQWDDLSANMALASVAQLRPAVLLLNLPGADVYGHIMGGPANPAVMSTIISGLDENIGRLVAAYRDAGMYDQTLFAVVADHGMVMNTHVVLPKAIDEAVIAGGGTQIFHTGGTASYIYLKDPTKSAAVAAQIRNVGNVSAVYTRNVVKGKTHYLAAAGQVIEPQLDRAYRFLLSTFSGSRSPDVVATFRENTIGQVRAVAYGHHGGLNWGVQNVPLVLSGPGVRAGVRSDYPARLVDVAPTVLRLLGLDSKRMDGIVLADGLSQPAQSEIHAQSTRHPALGQYRDALATQSQLEVADDIAHGSVPPPLPHAIP